MAVMTRSPARGFDVLLGGTGNDQLHGMAGGDMLYGGLGNDFLAGGNDSDVMTGRAGADVFVFTWNGADTEGETWGFDVVTDFVIGLDHIRLKFLNLSRGTNAIPLLTGTADGTLVTLDGAGTILFRGLDAIGYGLDDLLA